MSSAAVLGTSNPLLLQHNSTIMKPTFTLLIGIFVWVFAEQATAQQDFQYTQFMFNKLNFNPAYAGTKQAWCLSGIYRKQWFGIDRAPQTATLNVHGAVANKRVGLGLSVSYDEIGFSNRVSTETSYSYLIPFKKRNAFLSFGLRAGLYYNQTRWDEADLIDAGDMAIPQTATSRLMPNFGAGVYYQSQRWYAGFSVPHIFQNQGDLNIASSNGVIEPDFTQHYYGMGGFTADMSENIQIQFNTLAKYVVNSPLSLDLNISFVFVKRVLFGVTYRVGDSIDALFQWQITPQLRIAAAYDFSTTPLQRFNSGSIEAMISYCFIKPSKEEGGFGSYLGNERFF